MTKAVPPVGPVEGRGEDRREAERRARDRRAERRALIPVEPAQASDVAPDTSPAAARTTPAPSAGEAALAAQLMGQSGARKGLKGGPPVLDAARASYLSAQYAGPGDRRPKRGSRGETEI